MSSTLAPVGFVPVYHPSGQLRPRPYTFATGYATAIGKGDVVCAVNDGTVAIGTATNDLLGVVAGFEYTDSAGVPVKSPNWVASTAATNIVVWVYDDPETVYTAQSAGSIAATAVFNQIDMVAGTVNATTGLSAQTLAASAEAGGAQGQFRILQLDPAIDNAWGDAYTRLYVQISQHNYRADKVGI